MQVEEYIVDIIRTEMNLPQQNIWIQSQNRKIPPQSQELFCVVGVTNFKPISSKSRWLPETQQEEQVVYGRADVQVDLMSRSNEARVRRSELLMALNSYYSKNVQDSDCFRIFELPTMFINTSGLQGGSDINRFTLIIPTMISEVKIKGTDYYDKFRMQVIGEKGEIANINMDSTANFEPNTVETKFELMPQSPKPIPDRPDVPDVPLFIFQINPIPTDAIVTINGIEQNSVTVERNTEVEWSVGKEGYISQSGKQMITADESLAITLLAQGPLPFVQTADWRNDGITIEWDTQYASDYINKTLGSSNLGTWQNGYNNFTYSGTGSDFLTIKSGGLTHTFLIFDNPCHINNIRFKVVKGANDTKYPGRCEIRIYNDNVLIASGEQAATTMTNSIYTLEINEVVTKIDIYMKNVVGGNVGKSLCLNGLQING